MKYLRGNIKIDGQTYRVLVFDNSYKQNEKHPDKMVYSASVGKKLKEIGALWEHTKDDSKQQSGNFKPAVGGESNEE